ncbi:MAG: LytTR family DNA-binding domain-containing protein [Bacteroidales bacterium]|nr:LytTR family DNA-binding domain-containing protein [Bacteroidales bacterium]MCM1416596.1 LytTR family DNA-binding domain-containing protein [bacterium]MCM1424818.1 LytTR family DNA-binding domain-containing protein [bacterium]
MRIAVCDDDWAIREELFRLIKKQAPEADIAAYQSGKEMISAGEAFDISFLDVEMGEISGMDVAKQIREKEESLAQRSILIFVTGYREYMEEAFDVNAFHYLVKPIDPEKFAEIFLRARKEVAASGEQNRKQIMVKSSDTRQKIWLRDIYYIESSNKKVIIHTTNGILEVYGKMEELENSLGNSFYRCHRCYLVNMEKISAYSAGKIQVTNGDDLLFARKKYSDFVKTYMRYVKNGGIVNV